MGIASPRILIVDDKQEEGEAIARTLWRMGHAALFVQYGPELMTGAFPQFRGVRLVFMDLDLIGNGNLGDGSSAFGAVEGSITALLADDNGPWTLVTWTRHEEEGRRLEEELRMRLPPALHPVGAELMEKEGLILADGSEPDPGELERRVRALLEHKSAFRCLLAWESGVIEAANGVVSDLNRSANSSGNDAEHDLGCLLYKLAAAEAQETLESNRTAPLHRLLNVLLNDHLLRTDGNHDCCTDEYLTCLDEKGPDIGWMSEIHTMLHFDTAYRGACCPGAVYSWPGSGLPKPMDISAANLLEKEFLFYPTTPDQNGQELISGCQLSLIEVTPPCDHNMNRLSWRRFVVGTFIPDEKLPKTRRDKLNKAYFKKAPLMNDSSGNRQLLILNANLQVVIPVDQLDSILGNPIGRLKEQFMADVLDWLGHHISRTGIASM